MATKVGFAVVSLLLLAVLSSKLDAADSYRLRADRVDGASTVTGWGNCIPVASDLCITACHCVEGGGISVEINRAWVRAEVLATDKANDLALIRVPNQDFRPVELGVFPLVVKAAGAEIGEDGQARHSQIKVHVAVPERLTIRFHGMKPGMSGSPVLVGGRLVAMVSNVMLDPAKEHPDKMQPTDVEAIAATTIPASIIKQFLDDNARLSEK